MKAISRVSLNGVVTAIYPVLPLTVDRAKTSPAPELAHVILVVDRSGSMSYSMREMKQVIGQVLAIQDFQKASLLISFVSYSSTGDVKTHFTRVPVSNIMKTGSREQAELEALQATYLTCISGGLETAERLVRDGETTAILLHTDGCANDPSPYTETLAITKIIDRLSAKSNVVVNSIVHGSYADFKLLDMIATRCGGRCAQARSPKEVYTILHDSVAQMAGRPSPAIRVEAPGMIMAISKVAEKVMFGQNELFLRGLSDGDDVTVYSIGEAQVPSSTVPDPSNYVDAEVAQAFARALLSLGQLNPSKEIVFGTRDSLLYPHQRALTGPQLADFALALETAIFEGKHEFVEKFGIMDGRPTVVELVGLLHNNAEGFQVHMPTLLNGYQKRSIKKIAGIREKDGSLTPLDVRTENKREDWLSTTGFAMNRASATINMLVTTSQRLFKKGADGEQEVTEIKGIRLNLQAFNNYTLIGDGDVKVKNLRIRVIDKTLGKRLTEMGFPPADGQVGEVVLPIGELNVVPVTNVGTELVEDLDIVQKLIALRIASSLLSATIKGKSVKYTEDQVNELKKFYVTPSLNASLKSTVHYTDLKEAISKGWVDEYTIYKTEVGTPQLPSLSALYSANKFLDRMYVVTVATSKVKEPNMLDAVNPNVSYTIKTPKTATVMDSIQKPWFDQFLGLSEMGPWNEFLTNLGLEDEEITEFLGWKGLEGDRRVELFTAIVKKAEGFAENLFAQVLAPTVIFMGATGFVPDAIQGKAEMLTPEAFKERYKVELKKDLLEATFFILPGDRVLSVRPESAKFTTPEGLAAIKGPIAEDDE